MKSRDRKISAFLEQLGIPRHRVGFDCSRRLIQAYMDGYTGKITYLYCKVSKQTGHDAERAARYALGEAMKINPDFFRIMGLPESRWGTPFTTMEFVTTAAAHLKEQEELEASDERP